VTSDSVPEIGRSLQNARTKAGLSLPDAAIRIGVASSELDALESGTVARMADRVETLRCLRLYANSLGLPGDSYVLTLVELWPNPDLVARNGDTGVVPVVSLTAAPAGGHAPSGAYGSAFGADSISVSDSTVTGVTASVSPLTINDTRPVPIFETGQVQVVRQGAPTFLKVLVGFVAVLVVAAAVGLSLHNQISRWIHSAQNETTSLVNQAKKEAGITTSNTKTKHHQAALPKVTATASGPSAVTYAVDTPRYAVQVVVNGGPSWVQVTNAGSQSPVFSQVIADGGSKSFPVTSTTTIETGSKAAHFFVFYGLRTIGFYYPTQAPFTVTFTTSNG